ncbi:hypothetical protein IW15_06850 [Chryseobacterium soli]|uniref:Uncharacterized protein n=1 Tax=Chryseobacterium soli TaxID=445961 RepID=A0A086A9Y7_9FLAO|nr:hypothetical protein [Chryseobacterium soli]KFF13501.1 hypothetical protein IW15_06850 [Chryseobacterium soli]
MKKYLAVRIGIALIGFVLIYCYAHWDSWFHTHQSIGGNDGMSIPMDLVLNISWGALWCLFILIEMIVSFFTGRNKENRSINVVLLIAGIIFLGIYIATIK